MDNDKDFKEYKEIIGNIDKETDEKFKDGGYYIAYLITLGGKMKLVDMFNNALTNKTGYLFAENTTDLICITNDCIKETINEVWNTAKLSLFTGNPDDDKNDNSKYLRYGGMGLGFIQTIVYILYIILHSILFPLFLFIIQLMYIGFRVKGHNCCCECSFSCVSCCCSCCILIFALFGIFGFLPMLMCNMIPDIADIATQLDTVTDYLNKDDIAGMNMSYDKDKRSVNLKGEISGYDMDVNILLENFLSGYLGGNCDKYSAPLYSY